MLKQFYEKALATQGVYCATGIEPGEAGKAKVTNKFAESIDDLLEHVEAIKKKGWNAKELSTTQMLEIVSQKEYKTPGIILG